MGKELVFNNIVLQYNGKKYLTDDIYGDKQIYNQVIRFLTGTGLIVLADLFNNDDATLILVSNDLEVFDLNISNASEELTRKFFLKFRP